jgi:hypothetical protein
MTPATRATIRGIFREHVEQRLVEVVLGVEALSRSEYWGGEPQEQALSEEALTACVYPGWALIAAIDKQIGHALGRTPGREGTRPRQVRRRLP